MYVEGLEFVFKDDPGKNREKYPPCHKEVNAENMVETAVRSAIAGAVNATMEKLRSSVAIGDT